MSTTTDLSTLKINYLTQAQYETALANSQINEDELYLTTDGYTVPSTTNYTATSLKNIIESTSDPGTTSAPNGTVWLKYGDATLPTMADYVVEQHVAASPEDNWSWTKWNSGKAECWIEKKYSSQAINTAWGSCYYADLGTVSFPFTFVTTASSAKFPFVQVTSKATAGRCWIVENAGTSLTSTGNLYAISPSSYSNAGSVLARIYVVGLWK